MFDDVDVNPLQPVRDETDQNRQGNHGGWEKIFEHCQNDESILSALSSNDYVVIHIDTDCAEHVNFGVALTENGADKTDERLIAEVKELIASKVNTDIYQSYQNQILFAVAVHSLECWLLVLYADTDKEAAKTKRCEYHLKRLLIKKNMPYQKDAPCYIQLCGRKQMKNLKDVCGRNQSLSVFVADLMRINQSND
jgi:hypothetical protein